MGILFRTDTWQGTPNKSWTVKFWMPSLSIHNRAVKHLDLLGQCSHCTAASVGPMYWAAELPRSILHIHCNLKACCCVQFSPKSCGQIMYWACSFTDLFVNLRRSYLHQNFTLFSLYNQMCHKYIQICWHMLLMTCTVHLLNQPQWYKLSNARRST